MVGGLQDCHWVVEGLHDWHWVVGGLQDWHLSRLPVEELPAVQAGYFEQPLLSESGPAHFQ